MYTEPCSRQSRLSAIALQLLQTIEEGDLWEWPEFAETTLIRSGKQMVPFRPYAFQKRIVDLLETHRGAVICKTRQLGLTEAISSWFLKKANENPAYAAVVFSKTQEDASNISRRVRLMAGSGHIPLVSEGAMRVAHANGSQLFFRPSTDDAARGLESIHDLLFDEAAFPKNVQAIYGAASPTQNMVGDDARTIFVSTPNGKGGFFWKLLVDGNPDDVDVLSICQRVREGELYSDDIPGFYWFVDNSGWVKIFVHWRAHPDYSGMPDYLETVRSRDKLDEATLEREHHLGFEDLQGQVFDTALIDSCLTGRWQPPVPGHRYLMGVDTSLGGGDYFVISVLDATTTKASLVGWSRHNHETSDYSTHQVLELIDLYKPQCCAIETNNGGQLYLDELVRRRPGIRYEGINTNRSSKPVNIGKLKLLMERGLIEFPNESTIRDEFRNFHRDEKGTMAAAQGFTDDIVMALGVAATQIEIPLFVARKSIKPQLRGIRKIF